MHELGESSDQDHAAIGTLASELGIDHLVCVAAPEYAQAIPTESATTVHIFASKEQAATMVASMNIGDVVLVKASRSEKLEELAVMITNSWSVRLQEMADTE
jgi:UDP-N-acetylmuramoyl-tripeptide--D-alanyl-D-alanine ligase